MRKITFLLTIVLFALQANMAFAGDDPSIQGTQRENITQAMNSFIGQNTLRGSFVIYDPVLGELKELELKELHSGIMKKGDFYVSCADFTDSSGKAYDIDFLVVENDGSSKTVEAVVHSVEGNKRKYHLEK